MEKRYKLLRDLPNAKAGEIFKRDNDGDLILENQDSVAPRCVIAFTDGEIKQFDILNPEKGWFKEIEEKKYGGRVPKVGDEFWFISYNGSVIKETWDDTPSDHNVFEPGNAFWTEEEAEKELKRRKAYVILKEDTKGFEPDWTDGSQPKYFVIYNYYDSELDRDMAYCYKASGQGLYFATEKDAQMSIKAHPQQWLDYLCVEEGE